MSDHTNAIRRLVLAHVETWRAVPDAKTPPRSVPQADAMYVRRREWTWQPRTWWYDNCLQLYRAGQNAIARVDVAAGRVSDEVNWNVLRGAGQNGIIDHAKVPSDDWLWTFTAPTTNAPPAAATQRK